MKNATIIKPVGKYTYFNLNAVLENGSSCSSQVWSDSGSPSEAAKRLLSWIEEGGKPAGTSLSSGNPVRHVFIHITNTNETYHYDLSDTLAVLAIKSMATISPAS